MNRDGDLRVGLIGYGLRGALAAHAHRPGRGSAVAAVCDPRPERREAARQRFGPELLLTAELGPLLGCDLDAVFVLSPDHLHEEHAVAALRGGLATYVEKPLAISVAGCDRVLLAARESGARLYVGHNMRHMPVIRVMRDLIVDGAIGEVKAVWCRHFVGHGGDFYFKDWHAERARGTGLLLQKGAHDIDVIHWLAGSYTRRVNAMGALTVYGEIAHQGSANARQGSANARQSRANARHGSAGARQGRAQQRRTGGPAEAGDPADLPSASDTDLAERDVYLPEHDLDAYVTRWPPLSQTGINPRADVEDLSMVNMALDNGVLATYQQCHYTPDYWRNYTVIGTEGRLENVGDTDGAVVHVWNRRHRGHAAPDLTASVGDGDGGHGGADPAIVGEFLRFARAGGLTDTSPVAAREAVATGCAATESLRGGGRPVQVCPPPADLTVYFDTAHVDTGQRRQRSG